MPTRNQLARIHIAKRDLNLSDSLYRDFLQIWFGKRSAKNLTLEEIEELLTHFKGLGWGQEPSTDPQKASLAQLHKIQTLWMTGPGVRNKTPSALLHFLQHHFHISGLAEIKASQVAAVLGAVRKIAEHPSASKDKPKPGSKDTPSLF